MIELKCSNCETVLSLGAEQTGDIIYCPACGEELTAPPLDSENKSILLIDIARKKNTKEVGFDPEKFKKIFKEPPSPEPVFIRNVIEYAMQNMSKPIGIEELAKVAEYSRFHFSRVFHEWYGKSPSDFLREIRLQRAVRLLQTEMISVGDISVRCGFRDPSYFCKVFRKEFGVSPETFRKLK